MKKLLSVAFVIALFASCATPYQITETITKDSTGKEVHVITKKYDNGTTTVVPAASVNVVASPFWFGYGHYYSMPYYVAPRVVVPVYRGSSHGRRH